VPLVLRVKSIGTRYLRWQDTSIHISFHFGPASSRDLVSAT
jgi:hypothetical protein